MQAGACGAVAGAALVVTAAFAFADFARVYFSVYPAQAADEFKYGTADLFARVRSLGPGKQRVCFASLDWYNYETFVDFYMSGSALKPIEGLDAACSLPGSLIVVDAPLEGTARRQARVRAAGLRRRHHGLRVRNLTALKTRHSDLRHDALGDVTSSLRIKSPTRAKWSSCSSHVKSVVGPSSTYWA